MNRRRFLGFLAGTTAALALPLFAGCAATDKPSFDGRADARVGASRVVVSWVGAVSISSLGSLVIS